VRTPGPFVPHKNWSDNKPSYSQDQDRKRGNVDSSSTIRIFLAVLIAPWVRYARPLKPKEGLNGPPEAWVG
jgi:hypothetical protein